MNARKKKKFDPELMFNVLLRALGPQRWWPAPTRFEMMVGAILTQNTAWAQVELAMRRLKRARALSIERLHRAPLGRLAEWIRPAGTPRVKALRLRALTTFIVDGFGGSLTRLFRLDTATLRRRLLDVKGIGPETADCILLYAGRRPVFVVDAYTRRILGRHRWLGPAKTYDEVARRFTDRMTSDPQGFNEYHALIVEVGKRFCRAKPACGECPLRIFLPTR